MRFLLPLLICIVPAMQAQTPPAIASAVRQGASLSTDLPQTVKENVGVQAVMLPYPITKELFGKHIADLYVAVFVNIGNRSTTSSLVLQGLYLDYSKWALSGAVTKRDGDNTNLEDYSSGTWPGEVSSVEYRIVRGQLEDQQPKTIRNWFVRGLQFAGAVAAAYAFPASANSVDIVKGIAAANGVVIPGVEKLWPDNYISRLNRISDFGYRANRIIPRESSDVMVAFFPIDRFLTPGLKAIFIKTPALFFNPGLGLIDKQTSLEGILPQHPDFEISKLRGQISKMIACKESKRADSNACRDSIILRQFVSAASVNSIAVVVDGSMVVDLAAVPAIIDSVTFETGSDEQRYWAEPGSGKALTIRGRFLSGAKEVRIDGASALGISKIDIDSAASGEVTLKASMTLSRAIAPGASLRLSVVKRSEEGRETASAVFTKTVDYQTSAPTVTGASLASTALTINGRNLFSANMSLQLEKTIPDASVQVITTGFSALTPGPGVSVTVPALTAGCFDVVLFTGGARAAFPKPLAVAPTTTLTAATRSGKTVTVTGTGLLDLKACGAGLEFRVRSSAAGATAQAVTKPEFKGTTGSFEFDFPTTAGLTFTVELHDLAASATATPKATVAVPQ